jgi:uncharacterized OB-fold protein
VTSEPSRARPVFTDLTQPFWDAAKERRLAIQRCQDCGYYNHPPRPLCDRCLSDKLAFEDVSGNGTLWSFTVMHQKSVAGFEESVPYATALIELDEQPMLLLPANLSADSDLAIGRRMRVSFQAIDGDFVLPQFVPADS